ncbi:MAG TPA: carboxypeptidase-like regulatory domain-containing protein [Tepidisphaeraceae bacterium]|jgi:hypothetical protein|nr:carboxypeptidase-like regulatory domain-containing protein [Tepidisphaeraceae bacterium]
MQADLDEIWLSPPLHMTITPLSTPLLNLDIPNPGAAVQVDCVDAAGKPIAGAKVIVERPDGPLASLDWPANFVADGAGQAWIPTLGAGEHAIKSGDGSASVAVTVAPLPSAEVTVKLQSRTNGAKPGQ